MSDLSNNQLDALAKRIVDEQEARKDAKDEENPNAYLFAALNAKDAKDRALVRLLGLETREEPVPDFRTSDGGEVGGLG